VQVAYAAIQTNSCDSINMKARINQPLMTLNEELSHTLTSVLMLRWPGRVNDDVTGWCHEIQYITACFFHTYDVMIHMNSSSIKDHGIWGQYIEWFCHLNFGVNWDAAVWEVMYVLVCVNVCLYWNGFCCELFCYIL